MLTPLFERIGTHVLRIFDQAGDFAVISGRAIAAVPRRPFDPQNLAKQFLAVGVNSIPVVLLTSLAVSMVFAVQLAYGFKQFNPAVTWAAVLVIIVIVQLVQFLGNALARRVLRR